MNNNLPPWQSFLEHAELSDVGLRRSNNQDSFRQVTAGNQQQWQSRGHLFMVADGMGAHAAGELASKMAVDAVGLTYYKLLDRSAADALRKAIEEANDKIHAGGQANPDFKGMGTTTSVLLLLPEGAVVGHVGDSRVYRLRGNRLEQLSFDHSLVWEMMAGNKLTEGEMPGYIPKNIITRSLGPTEHVQVDLEGPFPLAVGDTFLLCSDGLSGPVGDTDLGIVLATLPPAEAARTLVDLANLRGGPDNITVLVARVLSMPPNAGGSRAARGPGQAVATGWWVALGVLGLAAAALVLAQQHLAAAGCGVAALGTALTMFLRRFSGGDGQTLASGARLGRGPHRSYVCELDLPAAQRMAAVVEPLREEAVQQHWEIDWPHFDGLCRQAATAQAGQDYAGAIRAYCRAISFMMQQLRTKQARGAKPAVDLDAL
ncbi:MAG TPA: PP2C family serine/threonine-protein phosphatase [Pirellulales bacterium]